MDTQDTLTSIRFIDKSNKSSLSYLRADNKNPYILKCRSGFTIIELLIAIVIIGILAVITLVAYSGIVQRANAAVIKSDLSNDKTILELYKTEHESYPTSLDENNCPTAPIASSDYCLESSAGVTLSYLPSSQVNAIEYSLFASKDEKYYRVSNNGQMSENYLTKVCPHGFIVVPGSVTYGTSDFCVMKYEAKADDNGDGVGDTNRTTGYDTWPANTYPISVSRKLVSSAQGYPVAVVSQVTASTAASNFTYGCVAGCHLITEAEWMTIAQNVLSVPSNWSGGAVGSGYIYRGHTHQNPSLALAASQNDQDGLYGMNFPSSNTRRTLTLTNGEVIWDMGGNMIEWTAGQTTGGQPGLSTDVTHTLRQWNQLDVTGSLVVNPFPSNTGIAGAALWDSNNGIGRINSYVGDAVLRGLLRSGDWDSVNNGGILYMSLNFAPTSSYTTLGFRVAQ